MHNRLILLRKNLQLNQGEFAKKIGISQTYLSEIERGNRNPAPSFFISLTVVFGVSVDWLLTGAGKMFLKKDSDCVSDNTPLYFGDSDIRTVVELMLEMPEDRKKECLGFCKDKKFLFDLQKEKLKKSAG